MKSRSLAGLMFVIVLLLGNVACHGQESFDSSGTEIHYTVSGKEGEPVVLVHGFIGSGEEWMVPPPFLPPNEREKFQTVYETLSKDFMVIVPDCRGHGKSGKPKDAEQYGLEMVEDIVRLLDHLDVEKAHVVGYSMGAFLSAKLVESHPDRVKSVVLGGGGALLEGSEQLEFMVSVGKSLEAGRGVEPIILALMPPGSPQPTAKQIEQSNQMFLANQDEQALTNVALSHTQLTTSKERLKANEVPVLLIVGGNDPLKASSEETTKLMPNSKLVVLDGHDHVSTMMSPDYLKNIHLFLKDNQDNKTTKTQPKEQD